MSELIRSMQVTDGTAAAERTPDSIDALYCTPEEMRALYGCEVTPEDIRAAMSLIHAWTNRPSLWPTEYEVECRIPQDRYETRLPVTPVISILEMAGRFAPGRRDRQAFQSTYQSYGALLMISGSRPQWVPIDPRTVELTASTGMIYIPFSFMIIPFSYVKCRYIAGLIEIPPRIKLALFELITQMHAKGVSDRTAFASGRVNRRYAGTSFVSEQAKMRLEPWVIRATY